MFIALEIVSRNKSHFSVSSFLFVACIKAEINQVSSKSLEFKVTFDVIPNDIPFLVGLPYLKRMDAMLIFKHLTLSFMISGEFIRISLEADENHIYLSCSSSDSSHYTIGRAAVMTQNYSN